MQIVGRAEIELTAGAFLAAERNGLVVIETEVLGDLTPHHHTTMWRGQGGDKEAVISASDRTRDGTGCETAKAIGDEPLARQQQLARMACLVPGKGATGENHSSRGKEIAALSVSCVASLARVDGRQQQHPRAEASLHPE